MDRNSAVYGGIDQLKEHIEQLEKVIESCRKHGSDADELAYRLRLAVDGMEKVLNNFLPLES
jgi:hypothetical protein